MDKLNDKFKKSAENFSLVPSSGIWINVKSDIKRRERKRRIIIFFFLIAGIVGSGLFLFSNQPKKPSISTSLQISHERSQRQNIDHQSVVRNGSNHIKENVAPNDSFSQKSNQSYRNEISPRQKKNLKYPYSAAENKLASVKLNASTPNEHDVNNSQEAIKDISVLINVPAILYSNVKTALADLIQMDSLQIEIKNESVSGQMPDTLRRDSLITSKGTSNTASHPNKLSISIGVAPTVSYTEFNEKGDYRIIANYRDSANKNPSTWNYHLAIRCQIVPELDVFLETGLINYEEQILNREAVYHYDTTILTGPQPIPVITVSRSYFNINGDSSGVLKNKFSWAEIALGIRYNFLPNRKFNISLQPEISFNKLVSCNGYKYNHQNRIYEKVNSADLRPWLVSYGIGFSFQYALRKNIYFEFTPNYRKVEKSIYTSASQVSQELQQTEFRFSLSYLIK